MQIPRREQQGSCGHRRLGRGTPVSSVLGRDGEWTSQEQGKGEERFRVNGAGSSHHPF